MGLGAGDRSEPDRGGLRIGELPVVVIFGTISSLTADLMSVSLLLSSIASKFATDNVRIDLSIALLHVDW